MSLIALKCPSCNANLSFEDNRDFGFCEFCGAKILIRDITQNITNNFYLSNERVAEESQVDESSLMVKLYRSREYSECNHCCVEEEKDFELSRIFIKSRLMVVLKDASFMGRTCKILQGKLKRINILYNSNLNLDRLVLEAMVEHYEKTSDDSVEKMSDLDLAYHLEQVLYREKYDLHIKDYFVVLLELSAYHFYNIRYEFLPKDLEAFVERLKLLFSEAEIIGLNVRGYLSEDVFSSIRAVYYVMKFKLEIISEYGTEFVNNPAMREEFVSAFEQKNKVERKKGFFKSLFSEDDHRHLDELLNIVDPPKTEYRYVMKLMCKEILNDRWRKVYSYDEVIQSDF